MKRTAYPNGADFRPKFALNSCPAISQVPAHCLTAKADIARRQEIIQRFAPARCRSLSPVLTAQYFLSHCAKNNPRKQLLDFLPAQKATRHCLLPSRKSVESTAEYLVEKGYSALPYHAGLDNDLRAFHQQRFLKEEGLIMVATIAFGMGIDKSNVRFVAHLDLPKSIEAYYQETGRAGRDGLAADAWMVYGLQDVLFLKQMLASSDSEERFKRVEKHKLDAMLALCEENRCRRQVLLGYFDEQLPEPCGHCDNCVEPPRTWNATEAARQALSTVYRTGQS